MDSEITVFVYCAISKAVIRLKILLLFGVVKQMVMTQNVNLNSSFLFKCEEGLLVCNECFGKS